MITRNIEMLRYRNIFVLPLYYTYIYQA